MLNSLLAIEQNDAIFRKKYENGKKVLIYQPKLAFLGASGCEDVFVVL